MAPRGERVTAEAFGQVPRLSLRLVLDNLRSGQNVGACFRSADAFRIDGLDLCGITCHPPHRDILKSALGQAAMCHGRPTSRLWRQCRPCSLRGGRWRRWSKHPRALRWMCGVLPPRSAGRWCWATRSGGSTRSVGRVRRHPRDATIWREAEHQRQRLCRHCLVASSLDDAAVTHQ